MSTTPIAHAPRRSTTRVEAAPVVITKERKLEIASEVFCLLLLGFLFRASLRHFVWAWSTDENYSHGFLVPLISLYFAREALRSGPIVYRSGTGLGLVLLACALGLNLATILVPVPFVADLALLVGLAGLCAVLLGAEALRRFGFAIGFLLFMVPLPVALYTAVASPLQFLVSRIAAQLLGVLGVPVYVQGNLMTLPGDIQMFVAEACSGMRQLTGFLALTTAVVYLSRRPLWHRVTLILSSVPIAMSANVVRVMMTGCIMYHIDPQFALGAYHTLEGLLMMGLGLMMLYAESWTLDQVGSLIAGGTSEAEVHPRSGSGS